MVLGLEITLLAPHKDVVLLLEFSIAIQSTYPTVLIYKWYEQILGNILAVKLAEKEDALNCTSPV